MPFFYHSGAVGSLKAEIRGFDGKSFFVSSSATQKGVAYFKSAATPFWAADLLYKSDNLPKFQISAF